MPTLLKTANTGCSQNTSTTHTIQCQLIRTTMQVRVEPQELLQHFRCSTTGKCTYNNQNCTSVLSTREINLRAACTCVVLFTANLQATPSVSNKRARQGSEGCPAVEEDKMARGVQTNAYSARISGCAPLLLSPASKFVDSFNRTLNI